MEAALQLLRHHLIHIKNRMKQFARIEIDLSVNFKSVIKLFLSFIRSKNGPFVHLIVEAQSEVLQDFP